MPSAETLRIPAFKRKKQISKKLTKKSKAKIVRKAKVTKVKPKIKKMKKPTMKKKMAKKAVKMERTKRSLQPGLIPIGMVSHFYDKISVGVLKLSKPLKVGDRIQLRGKHDEFVQTVSSIQIEHRSVNMAQKGADIGIKVDQPVRIDEIAYLVP